MTPLVDDGDDAVFRVNGARVFIRKSGRVGGAGLPDCPTYAPRLLPDRFLPAIAADLLSRGNPHKRFLHSQAHTPESFVEYLQNGTILGNPRSDGGDSVSSIQENRSATDSKSEVRPTVKTESDVSERIYCNKCRRKTLHRLLLSTGEDRTREYSLEEWEPESGEVPSCIFFDMLECCGCREAVLRRTLHCPDADIHRQMGSSAVASATGEMEDDVRYFPPRTVRDLPKWRVRLPVKLKSLLEEIYKSLDVENLRLPMMGARTLVDMMILEKVGDVGGVKEKLRELEKEGFVSSRNREALYAALEMGNAAAHRGHVATESEVPMFWISLRQCFRRYIFFQRSPRI